MKTTQVTEGIISRLHLSKQVPMCPHLPTDISSHKAWGRTRLLPRTDTESVTRSCEADSLGCAAIDSARHRGKRGAFVSLQQFDKRRSRVS